MTFAPEPVDYADGDVACRGHLVVDRSTQAPRPGVVLFPDARGVSRTTIAAAQRLAPHGFAVFVADLYGGATFHEDIPEAHKLMTALRSDVDRWRARAQAALDVVANLPVVDPRKIAAIGYCFGGGTALELGRSGAPLSAIVSFHGGLASPRPQDAANIKGPVLVCHGAADPIVPPAQLAEFVTHMTQAHVDWQLHAYAGVVHTFTNPELANSGLAEHVYDANADASSFQAMLDLFGAVFSR